MAKLGDIATYINGYAFKPEDWSDEGVRIIRIQDLSGNSYQTNRYNGPYAPKYEVNDGDVLISWSASLGVYIWHGEKAVLNQHIFKVVFDKVEVDKSFFVHQVGEILEKAVISAHGATMKHLTKPVFDALPFYLPPIDEQRCIASILDKVTDLITKRRTQLEKLDLLVKSRFVEMFGDPVENNFNWKTNCLKRVTKKIGSGATPKGGKGSYQNEGISLIRSMNVHDSKFEYKDLAHINSMQAEQLNNVIVEKYDVLINITGASVARSCVVPENVLPARVNQHVSIIRCCDEQLNHIFVNCLFLNESYKRKLLSIGEAGGATRQAITKQQLEDLIVILPPIELQKQFASFVQQTETTKSNIQKSLETLETLKKALMQEYFA